MTRLAESLVLTDEAGETLEVRDEHDVDLLVYVGDQGVYVKLDEIPALASALLRAYERRSQHG